MTNLVLMAVGAIAGLLAEYGLKDEWIGGVAGNLVLGVIGSFLFVWVLNLFSRAGSGINAWSLIAAFIGATALLWGGRAVTSTKILN